jgi:hypothetical protein
MRTSSVVNEACLTNKDMVSTLYIESSEGNTTPLSMDWISSSDNDDSSFTMVENRKKRNMKRKSNVSASRPITRSQKSKRSESTNSGLSPHKIRELEPNKKKLQ